MWIWIIIAFVVLGAILGTLADDGKGGGCLIGAFEGLMKGTGCVIELFLLFLLVMFACWLFS